MEKPPAETGQSELGSNGGAGGHCRTVGEGQGTELGAVMGRGRVWPAVSAYQGTGLKPRGPESPRHLPGPCTRLCPEC